MRRAGRDERGRFIRDDAIVKQIVTPILGALTLLMDQVEDKTAKEAIAAFIVEATIATGVLDVGTKPKGADDVATS
jgi:hypothetical protein